MNISPKRIREIAIEQYSCPKCMSKPGESCRYMGEPRATVCCDRYTKTKKGVGR